MGEDRLVVDEAFMSSAQVVLRGMLAAGITESPLGDNFPNLVVIIGHTEKTTVLSVEVPADLAEEVGDQPVYVANK